MSKKTQKTCPQCSKNYEIYPSQEKKGEGKFCSKECYFKSAERKTVACEFCSEDMLVKQPGQKFCSRQCLFDSKRHNFIKQCLVCDKDFRVIESELETRKYCSKECYLVEHSDRNQMTRICLGCEKEFSFPKYRDQTCCSLSCNTQWKKKKRFDEKHTKINCAFCKKKIFMKNWKIERGGKFCSKKCHSDWMSVNLTGENSFGWKGGLTPFYRSLRTCTIYRKWRASVLKRDKHTCQDCDKKDCRFEVDHINPLVQIVFENKLETLDQAKKCDALWDISNGRTLCKPCHHKKSAEQRQLVVDISRGIHEL